MRLRTILILSGLLVTATMRPALAQKFNLLIGTYTSPGGSEGIYVYEFDAKTGEATYKNKVTGLSNPSYLAIAPDRKHVYAVSEAGRGNGAVTSFSYQASDGALKLLNKQPSGGDGPCYVSVDATGKYVFAANYGGGSIGALPVLPDGSLGADLQSFTFEGGGPDKSRQDKAHLHCVVLSPDNQYLFANDLGTDRTYIYQIDHTQKAKPLTPAPQPYLTIEAGSGPRHITFHPNKKFAYLVQELKGSVSVLSYNQGKLALVQTASTLPENFKGKFTSADIHVSPDGKFLYASNRGDINEIVVFSIDPSSGKITYAGRQSALGKTTRNFAIDPTGNFLLAANQDSNDIFIFARNKKTGLLTPTGKKLEVSKPVCLKFDKAK